jgi:ribosomal protein S1
MPNEWDDFARQHKVGDVLSGRIVNVTDFGLFIDIYNGLEGLAHVSEIDVPGGAKLEDRFAVGDYVRTRILRIEEDEKKVGLSMRGVTQPSPNEVSELKAEAAARRHQASGSGSSAGSAANGALGAAATAHDASEAHEATPAHEANSVATADTEGTVAAPAASASTAEPGRGGKRREAKKQQQQHDEHAGSSE